MPPGITINDSLFLDVGITVAASYCSFGKSIIRSSPNETDYQIRGIAKIWPNKTQRDNNCDALQTQSVAVGATKGQLNDIYPILYTELKTNYISVIDIIE